LLAANTATQFLTDRAMDCRSLYMPLAHICQQLFPQLNSVSGFESDSCMQRYVPGPSPLTFTHQRPKYNQGRVGT